MVDAIDICGDAATVAAAVRRTATPGSTSRSSCRCRGARTGSGTIEATLDRRRPEADPPSDLRTARRLTWNFATRSSWSPAAGSGIGAALCRPFAAESPRALVVADSRPPGAGSVAAEIGRLAPATEVDARVDVSVEARSVSLVDATHRPIRARSTCSAPTPASPPAPGLDAPDAQWQTDLGGQRDGARLRGPGPAAGVGRNGAEGYLLITASAAGLLTNLGDAPYTVDQARRGRAWPSGSPSPTATPVSRCRACAPRACARRCCSGRPGERRRAGGRGGRGCRA